MKRNLIFFFITIFNFSTFSHGANVESNNYPTSVTNHSSKKSTFNLSNSKKKNSNFNRYLKRILPLVLNNVFMNSASAPTLDTHQLGEISKYLFINQTPIIYKQKTPPLENPYDSFPEIPPLEDQNIFYIGTCLISPNGKYRLELHTDGNLAIYENNGRVVWQTSTKVDEREGAKLELKPNGQLILTKLEDSSLIKEINVIQDRVIKGWDRPKLELNNDGELVISSLNAHQRYPELIWKNEINNSHEFLPTEDVKLANGNFVVNKQQAETCASHTTAAVITSIIKNLRKDTKITDSYEEIKLREELIQASGRHGGAYYQDLMRVGLQKARLDSILGRFILPHTKNIQDAEKILDSGFYVYTMKTYTLKEWNKFEEILKKDPNATLRDQDIIRTYSDYLDHENDSKESHAMTIVGHTKDKWLIKNTWGLNWANQGYFWANKKDFDLTFGVICAENSESIFGFKSDFLDCCPLVEPFDPNSLFEASF